MKLNLHHHNFLNYTDAHISPTVQLFKLRMNNINTSISYKNNPKITTRL